MSSENHEASEPRAAAEPSFAERARTLVHVGRIGTLATHSRRATGFPFASLAPYGIDELGRPTFLFSRLAMHTQNLLADDRASLLVTQSGWKGDPLAGGRVTLVGRVTAVANADAITVRGDYLGRHPAAAEWLAFKDFAFYRMDASDLYYVAGFGAMGWISVDDYGRAEPDPLADSAESILAHMNQDHADAVVLYCRGLAGVDTQTATMTNIDRLGFQIRAEAPGRPQHLRLGFPRQVRTADEARVALIELLRDARARLRS